MKQRVDEWQAQCEPVLASDEEPLSYYRVARALSEVLDRDLSIVTHDADAPRDCMAPFYQASTPHSYGSPTLGASGPFSPARASALRRIAVDIHIPAASNRSTWVTTRSIKPCDLASMRTLNVPQTFSPAACPIRRACPIVQENGAFCVLQRQSQYSQLARAQVHIQPLRWNGARVSHREPFVVLWIGNVITARGVHTSSPSLGSQSKAAPLTGSRGWCQDDARIAGRG